MIFSLSQSRCRGFTGLRLSVMMSFSSFGFTKAGSTGLIIHVSTSSVREVIVMLRKSHQPLKLRMSKRQLKHRRHPRRPERKLLSHLPGRGSKPALGLDSEYTFFWEHAHRGLPGGCSAKYVILRSRGSWTLLYSRHPRAASS